MPKNSYHVGNAISQIITDVLVAFHRTMASPGERYIYINHAWNVHGLPFEQLYTEATGQRGTYQDIEVFTRHAIQKALQEKQFFVDYCQQEDNVSYIDTDPTCKEFCRDCFYTLAKRGYILEYQGECFLNLEKFFCEEKEDWLASITTMDVSPPYHRAGILANQQTLGGLFPLTKQHRVFTPAITYHHANYMLNPIFQSLVYPCYIASRFHSTMPTLLQVSASGHGMLKWHYLRTILSYLLTQTIPYHHLLLHGTVLRADGTPMSKHKQNSLQPSDLYQRRADPSFIRYVLLKSVSTKDIPLQLQVAENEYLRVADKVARLHSGYFLLQNELEILPMLTRSLALLQGYHIKHAFEYFYLALKKAQVAAAPVKNHHLIAQLSAIFLCAKRDMT